MDMNSTASVYGLLTSSALFGIWFFVKRWKKISLFYDCVVDLVNNYYLINPRTPQTYFDYILISKIGALVHFWINDFQYFFIDPDKAAILVAENKKYIAAVEKERAEKVMTEFETTDLDEGDQKVMCPWCGNDDTESFEWLQHKSDEDGTIMCHECGMHLPHDSFEELIKILENEFRASSDVDLSLIHI